MTKMTPYQEGADAEPDRDRGQHHKPPRAPSESAIEPEASIPREVQKSVTQVITECRQDEEQQQFARRACRQSHHPRIAARASRYSDQSRDKQAKSHRQCDAAQPMQNRQSIGVLPPVMEKRRQGSRSGRHGTAQLPWSMCREVHLACTIPICSICRAAVYFT